jgi:hypothetical protein
LSHKQAEARLFTCGNALVVVRDKSGIVRFELNKNRVHRRNLSVRDVCSFKMRLPCDRRLLRLILHIGRNGEQPEPICGQVWYQFGILGAIYDVPRRVGGVIVSVYGGLRSPDSERSSSGPIGSGRGRGKEPILSVVSYFVSRSLVRTHPREGLSRVQNSSKGPLPQKGKKENQRAPRTSCFASCRKQRPAIPSVFRKTAVVMVIPSC